MRNEGIEREEALVKALDGKRIKNLNQNLQFMVLHIFKDEKNTSKLSCKLTDNYIKPDIVLSCNGKVAYISIKSGQAQVLHGENIKSFILFLRSIGISEETQKTILYFQFGDGTMDGTGEKRMNYRDTYNWLEKRIQKANLELNNRYETIEAVVERVMFQGVNPTEPSAEYIYFGDVDYGILVSKRQVYSHLKHKSWHYYDNLHIGPILLKAHARYADRQIVSDERRNKITCYWAKLAADLEYISKRYAL